jgi:hypothetical protein
MLQSTAHTDLTIACTALLLGILLILSRHRHIIPPKKETLQRHKKEKGKKEEIRECSELYRKREKKEERDLFLSFFLHYYISIPLLHYTEETHLVQERERWERIGVFAHSFWWSC